jgi:hypothetical protein
MQAVLQAENTRRPADLQKCISKQHQQLDNPNNDASGPACYYHKCKHQIGYAYVVQYTIHPTAAAT